MNWKELIINDVLIGPINDHEAGLEFVVNEMGTYLRLIVSLK